MARTPKRPPKPDPLRQESPGVRWIERDGHLAIDPSGDATDDAAAAEPITQQLHAAVLRNARAFQATADRLGNNPDWAGLIAATRRLLETIDRPTEEIPAFVGNLYDAALELGSFLDFDNRLIRDPAANATQLDPEPRRALEHLIRIAAPWVRRFPTIQALDDSAGAFLNRNDLFQPASELIAEATARGEISADDRDRLDDLHAAAQRGDFLGEKSAGRRFASLRNFVTAGAQIIALYIGLTANIVAPESPLGNRLGDFYRATIKPIERLFVDAAPDIAFAVADMLRRIIEEAPPAIRPDRLPPPEPRNPPDDFDEAKARALILAGDRPPEPWRPLITKLDLSDEKNFARLALLAGLTNLQTLDLNGTAVTDAAPLAALTKLQWLDLSNTQITDASMLGHIPNLILPEGVKRPTKARPKKAPAKRTAHE